MELRIGGADGFLVLRPDPGGSPYVAHAEVSIGDDLVVRRTVQQNYAGGFSDLAEFFESLAARWRGWQEQRAWESLDGELAPAATHDGRVRLRVEVRGPIDRGDWRVRCDLTVEPGEELSALARAARAFAMHHSATTV